MKVRFYLKAGGVLTITGIDPGAWTAFSKGFDDYNNTLLFGNDGSVLIDQIAGWNILEWTNEVR